MPSNIAQPLYPGDDVSCKATAAVTGRRFVGISTNNPGKVNPNVAHADAGSKPFGVSGYDVAAGEVLPVIRNTVVQVTAGANLTAKQEVEVGANGVAIVLAAGRPAGRVVFDAANGTPAFIELY